MQFNFEAKSTSVGFGGTGSCLKITFSPLVAAVGSFLLLLPREGLRGSMG